MDDREPPTVLSDQQRLDWLRLIRSENVGPATFRDLLDTYGSAAAALEALPGLGRKVGRRIRLCSTEEAERELGAIERLGARIVAIDEADYPPWLARIDPAPPLITIRGDSALLHRPAIGIVGSRNASVAGRKIAAMLAADLGRAGIVVASGLARGIDAAAHQASLATGTIAVFAGGLDCIYPPQNAALAAEILAAGGVHLSETPIGLEPRARDFPRRNRIVSGLSVGVIVVEAAERSGSLITARLAGEQGRLVFAVPGSPLDPRAAGANRLLRQGATMVTEAEHVLSEIQPMLSQPIAAPQSALREDRRAVEPSDHPERATEMVIEALGPSPIEVDEIIRFTGLRPGDVQLALVELDIAGRIERHAGQRVSLI